MNITRKPGHVVTATTTINLTREDVVEAIKQWLRDRAVPVPDGKASFHVRAEISQYVGAAKEPYFLHIEETTP